MKRRIVVCSDLHFPFQDKRKVDKFIRYVSDAKPDTVVINGDMYDFMIFSAHRKRVTDPKQELTTARKQAEEFIRRLKLIVPEVVYILGNHELRLEKRILDKMPEVESLINMGLFFFDGVKTVRDEIIIDNILFTHGISTNMFYHVDANLMSCVIGHSHRGYVVYKSMRNKTVFEGNSGCLCDFKSDTFGYMPFKNNKGWTHGCLDIETGSEERVTFVRL